MIALEDVHKRYRTNRGEEIWALRGVTATFPARRNIAVIGASGSGKSTLLRLIAGMDRPTRGTIVTARRVSWPIGQTRAIQANLTGRQNARFLSRIHGYGETKVEERTRFVQEFSELGEAFDRPVSSYSKGMRARLDFALSVAFDFEVYLVDERMGGGRKTDAFGEKTRNAMKFLARQADLVVATRSERIAREYCQSALWLHEGRGYWFDSLDEAWREHRRQVAA